MRAVALTAVVLVTVLSASAGPAAAAGEVSFGTPSASAVFGEGVTFSQPVTAAGANVRHVEILISRPGRLGAEVHPIMPSGGLATTTLKFRLSESDEHLYPNTQYSARWRIVDTDGKASVGPGVSVTYLDTRFAWQTTSGKLVRVHWYSGDSAFGRRALAIGEAGVARAEELFGVTETEPVDFYVYGDRAAFYDVLGPGSRENVGGVALPEIRTLFALIGPDQIDASWVGVVIPHELTHLVFDTATRNPFHPPVHWFNEGLAVYLSQGYDQDDRRRVRDAVKVATIIPLTGLGQFPTTADKFVLAYAESVSAIDFLVRTHGRAALVSLIGSYASGVTDDDAFTSALGMDMSAFDDAWLADIDATRLEPAGPRPDPPGPLPAGWTTAPDPVPAGSPPSPAGTTCPGCTSPSALPSLPASASPGTPVRQPTAATASDPAGPAGGSASAGPALTPGSGAAEGPSAPSGEGLAWLFGALAVAFAATVGIMAVRQRSGRPR